MNSNQQRVLMLNEIDASGAIQRLNGDEQLYISCLKMFLEDMTLIQLNQAISNHFWDAAFTAAHALKGLAGNLGFVSLMHHTGSLVILIRGGRTKELDDCLRLINNCYKSIADAIRQNF